LLRERRGLRTTRKKKGWKGDENKKAAGEYAGGLEIRKRRTEDDLSLNEEGK